MVTTRGRKPGFYNCWEERIGPEPSPCSLSGIAGKGMEEYISAFDFGAPSHGGAGLGLKRLVMLILNLGDVRNATLFHRDPKSLPVKPPALPHPERTTHGITTATRSSRSRSSLRTMATRATPPGSTID